MKSKIDPSLILSEKYLKLRYPFILEVDSIDLESNNDRLTVCINVTSSHFCEMYFSGKTYGEQIERMIKDNSSDIIKSIYPEWRGNILNVLFFPKLDGEDSIAKYIKK